MVIQTRILLGSKESPRFVSKHFYDIFRIRVDLYKFDFQYHPDYITYYIPNNLVVERSHQGIHSYEIKLTDTITAPMCRRRKYLSKKSFRKTKTGDRYIWVTEDTYGDYFLLVPNASYYNTNIVRNEYIAYLVYDDHVWKVIFREVYVDPHESSCIIWFHAKPQYQVEICTEQDFRGREVQLKRALVTILPGLEFTT